MYFKWKFFSIFDLFSQILENINIYIQIDNDSQNAHVNIHQRTQFKQDLSFLFQKDLLINCFFIKVQGL